MFCKQGNQAHAVLNPIASLHQLQIPSPPWLKLKSQWDMGNCHKI